MKRLKVFKKMEDDILKLIKKQEDKLNKIYNSVEKTRKYFLFTLIGTLVIFIVPLIVLIFLIPRIMAFYSGILNF